MRALQSKILLPCSLSYKIGLLLGMTLLPLVAQANQLPSSYEQSRTDFAQSVVALKAQPSHSTIPEIVSFPIPILGKTPNDNLAIDYVYIPPKELPNKLVVISTGIHGVEAPAGSQIAQALLNSCVASLGDTRKDAGIMIFHNMNPYGFKYGSRFNRNNVDLNRNSFAIGQFPGAQGLPNRDYDRMRNILERTGMFRINHFPSLALIYADVVAAFPIDIATGGFEAGRRIMRNALAGQYAHPEGIYFGGLSGVEQENAKAQEIIREVARNYRSALHLDIHTGLGKDKINHIMTNPGVSDESISLLRAIFPKTDTSENLYSVEVASNEPGQLVTNGDFTRVVCEIAGSHLSPCVAATAEIGVPNEEQSLVAVIHENVSRQKGYPDAHPKRLAAIKQIREYFTPKDPQWYQAVVNNNKVICDAIKTFLSAR